MFLRGEKHDWCFFSLSRSNFFFRTAKKLERRNKIGTAHPNIRNQFSHTTDITKGFCTLLYPRSSPLDCSDRSETMLNRSEIKFCIVRFFFLTFVVEKNILKYFRKTNKNNLYFFIRKITKSILCIKWKNCRVTALSKYS